MPIDSEMKVFYFATLRDITGKKDEVLNLPAINTLADLISHLCAKYGGGFRHWVCSEDGGFGSLSIFLINGIDSRSLNGMQTSLKDNDEISIFPPIAGG